MRMMKYRTAVWLKGLLDNSITKFRFRDLPESLKDKGALRDSSREGHISRDYTNKRWEDGEVWIVNTSLKTLLKWKRYFPEQ